MVEVEDVVDEDARFAVNHLCSRGRTQGKGQFPKANKRGVGEKTSPDKHSLPLKHAYALRTSRCRARVTIAAPSAKRSDP